MIIEIVREYDWFNVYVNGIWQSMWSTFDLAEFAASQKG